MLGKAYNDNKEIKNLSKITPMALYIKNSPLQIIKQILFLNFNTPENSHDMFF